MRKLKQLGLAVAFMLALSTCAMAGIIETPPAPTPPPPPDPIVFTGTIDTKPIAESANEPTDPVLSLALTLLQGVLSVF
jgi:hypothetical protein